MKIKVDKFCLNYVFCWIICLILIVIINVFTQIAYFGLYSKVLMFEGKQKI